LISFDHCIECPSLMYCFLLPLWYLLTIVLNVLLWCTVSYYLFDIFWPLYWMSFFDVLFPITSLISFDNCILRNSTSEKERQYNGQRIPKR
jgi:hypothetical protein